MLYVLNLVIGSYSQNNLLPSHHDLMFHCMLNDATVISDFMEQYNAEHGPNFIENKMVLTYNKENGLEPEELKKIIQYSFQQQGNSLPKQNDYVILILHAHAFVVQGDDGNEYRIALGGNQYLNAQDIFSCIEPYIQCCPVAIVFNTCYADTVQRIRVDMEKAYKNNIEIPTKTATPQLSESSFPSSQYDNKTIIPEKSLLWLSTLPIRFPLLLFGFSSDTVTFQQKKSRPLSYGGAFLKAYVTLRVNLSVKAAYHFCKQILKEQQGGFPYHVNMCILHSPGKSQKAENLLNTLLLLDR